MPNNAAENRLPVTLLTGFLGSGKTTLLRRVLTCPELSDTAVVINEVGEIAIDHYLVDFIAGDVVELPGGCLCCAVREDLARTLRGLLDRRDSADIRPFRRIAVETTGLADPGPILFTLSTDAMLDQRLRLERVVTVVDAVAGAATLDRFAEAARQAAIADALVVSKTDLAPFGPELAERLDALNPGAERLFAADADPATALFGARREHPSPRFRGEREGPTPQAWEGAVGLGGRSGIPHLTPTLSAPPWTKGGGEGVLPHHSHGIATYAIVLQRPVATLAFAQALGGLAQERGYDLLRVKGLVAFAERPERPAVIQAAQHAMFAPEWLDDWPDADHRNRLVFIVHDIAPDEILARFAFASPSLLGARASGPHAGGTLALRSIK